MKGFLRTTERWSPVLVCGLTEAVDFRWLLFLTCEFLLRQGRTALRRAAEMNIPVASYRSQTVEAQDFHRLATVATGKLSPAARLTAIRHCDVVKIMAAFDLKSVKMWGDASRAED